MNKLSASIYAAYCELFTAVENGIDNDNFFELRKTFRNIQAQVHTHTLEEKQQTKKNNRTYKLH